jgi:predicted membrane-bound spermidine synthase
VGRQPWSGKLPAITYFACLGAGFIILELVFIQLFMRLIGVPLYTYSVIIFTFLAAAGFGSWSSQRLGVHPSSRWKLPFVGIFVSGIALLMAQAFVVDIFLAAPIVIRSLVAVVLIAPLGFFLGMPLPLGILSLENKPAGAVAWAWGINGLFTGMGGLASVMLSITVGFRGAVIIALATYALAMVTFSKLAASYGSSTAA